jgi:hypothetical protein
MINKYLARLLLYASCRSWSSVYKSYLSIEQYLRLIRRITFFFNAAFLCLFWCIKLRNMSKLFNIPSWPKCHTCFQLISKTQETQASTYYTFQEQKCRHTTKALPKRTTLGGTALKAGIMLLCPARRYTIFRNLNFYINFDL